MAGSYKSNTLRYVFFIKNTYLIETVFEKETAARSITGDTTKDTLFNATGERFKNGILVDPFAGHSVGDVSLEDYKAAVHFERRQSVYTSLTKDSNKHIRF